MIRLFGRLLLALLMVGAVATNAMAQDSLLPATSLKEFPVLWQQTAAEYRALCYQAFNSANQQLNAIPKRTFRRQKLAIITDLDETILDNSYYDARLIVDKTKESYQQWKAWTAQSAATAVPGAVAFLQYAAQKGVTIFYVSNRDTADVKVTLANLQRLQLPNADEQHCLFMSSTSSKETRRLEVMQDYNVVLLLGDNLNDFSAVFEKRPVDQRLAATDSVMQEWGKRFIVLPNPTYGDWENALYRYQSNWTPAQKEAARLQWLNPKPR